MPEYARALVFVLVIGAALLLPLHRFCASHNFRAEGVRWRNAWVVVTVSAFLSNNFWIFASIVLFMVLLTSIRSSAGKIAFFAFLLPAFPSATLTIPGFGFIEQLFPINYPMLLSMFLLLPVVAKEVRKTNTSDRGSMVAIDLMVLTFYVGSVIAFGRDTTLTNTLRQAFLLFFHFLVPYLAVSRGIRSPQDVERLFVALIAGIAIQGLIGVVEAVKHWRFYADATDALRLDWGLGGYLSREQVLRGAAALGHPIVLGYVATIGLGFASYFVFQKGKLSALNLAVPGALILGLLASLSRGPWVGAVVLAMVLMLFAELPFGALIGGLLAAVLMAFLLPFIPGTEWFTNLLPFVGESQEAAGTIDYRIQLLENSWIAIQRHPWFGSSDYLYYPELEAMRRGHLIDLVNTYIQVALEMGLIGAGLFVFIFLGVLWGIWTTLRRLPRGPAFEKLRRQGHVIMAVIIAVLAMIFGLSSISLVPHYYWLLAGLGVAYIRVVSRVKKSAVQKAYDENAPTPAP